MQKRFTVAFEDIFASNKDGEVKNLLITDGNAEFLYDALMLCADGHWRMELISLNSTKGMILGFLKFRRASCLTS